MDSPASPDLLSDLPLCIIHVILSLLHIREHVITSIPSRKWRYIWSSLPYLDFDDKCVNPPMETEMGEMRLIRFISQALLLHEGPIHMFQLCLSHIVNLQCINQLFLSRNGTKNLVLVSDNNEGNYPYGFDIPSSLYSCQNLTKLKLHAYSIPPPPPSFKGFLLLKSLDIHIYDLEAAEVVSTTIESIVSHSPLLEDLTLDFAGYFKMTICALNLKYLHFYSMYDLSLCTPLLQELKGDFVGIKSFIIRVDSMVFHHLRTIQLFDVSFNNKEVTPVVIRLIRASLIYKSLKLINHPPELACFWDTNYAPDFTYNSLKVITIEFSRGVIDEMKLIEFLLARSPVLETLFYKPHSSLSDKKLLKLATQLLMYRRAFANAQIVITESRSILERYCV